MSATHTRPSPAEIAIRKAARTAKQAAKVARRAAERLERENIDRLERELIAHPASSPRLYGPLAVGASLSGDPAVSMLQLAEITREMDGEVVWVRCRMANCRAASKRLFFELRAGGVVMQALMEAMPRNMMRYCAKIPRESIVLLQLTVRATKRQIKCSSPVLMYVECLAHRCYVESLAAAQLPFQLRDAKRPGLWCTDAKTAGGEATVGRDVLLDNRVLALRTSTNRSIMRIRSGVVNAFRQFFIARDFIEIHTPKLLGSASEGGSAAFHVDYFGQDACLAQSPQFFKQMAIVADFGCVFEVGAVYRAEKSNTPRHLCEFVGMDFEMEIQQHYHEVVGALADVFVTIFDELCESFAGDLEVVRAQYPSENPIYHPAGETLVLSFAKCYKLMQLQCCALLRLEAQDQRVELGVGSGEGEWTPWTEEKLEEFGWRMNPGEDLATRTEICLGLLIKANPFGLQRHGVDFYIVDKFPMAARPFYTMPELGAGDGDDGELQALCADDVGLQQVLADATRRCETIGYSHSYDAFLRGQEITSGAQRIHNSAMLEASVAAYEKDGVKIDRNSIAAYLDSFTFACVPHGGAGIGLERVVFLFLSLPNIRQATMFPRTADRCAP